MQFSLKHWALHEGMFSTFPPQPDRAAHLHTYGSQKNTKIDAQACSTAGFLAAPQKCHSVPAKEGMLGKSAELVPAGKDLGVMLDEKLNVSQQCCLAAQKPS